MVILKLVANLQLLFEVNPCQTFVIAGFLQLRNPETLGLYDGFLGILLNVNDLSFVQTPASNTYKHKNG